MVGDMKQHQDRLLDTAAHLSNELGVNQEHVKVGGIKGCAIAVLSTCYGVVLSGCSQCEYCCVQNLYGALDEVKEGKADKETVQIEVEEVCVHVCSIRT